MESLSDQENEKILLVIARDAKLHSDFLRELRNRESSIDAEKARRQALIEGHNFQSQICVLCCSSFSMLANRAQQCRICRHSVCKSCMVSKDGGVAWCRLCDKESDLAEKRREWSVMYPYAMDSYAVQKLDIKARGLSIMQDSIKAWMYRARLEYLAESTLMIRLGDAFVDYCLSECDIDSTMHLYQQKLAAGFVDLLREWSNVRQLPTTVTKPLNNAITKKAIVDSLFSGLRQTVFEMLENGCSLNDSTLKAGRFEDFETMLAVAVVNKAVDTYTKQKPATGVSIGIQTEAGDNEEAFSDDETRSLATQHMRQHKVPLPPIEVDNEEVDSAFDIDDRESISSWSQNWFFRDRQMLSPYGSMRSNCSRRVPTRLSTLFNALPSSYEEAEEVEELSDLDSTHEKEIVVSSEPQASLAVSPPIIVKPPASQHCLSGDKVQFHCEVRGGMPVDVAWYNSNAEVKDQGRHRIFANDGVHYLEIYDCVPTDSGEIVCVAVNEHSLTSAVANLVVRDQDLAGEEPSFVEILEHVHISEGETVVFACRVGGFPEPRVIFYKNHQPLTVASERCTIENYGYGRWSLTLRDVTLADVGTYVAIASNRFGRISCKASLQITSHDTLDCEKVLANGSHYSKSMRHNVLEKQNNAVFELTDFEKKHGTTVYLTTESRYMS